MKSFNLLIIILVIDLCLCSNISSNIGKDYFRLNDKLSSANLAKKEFEDRVKFYNKIIKKWKIDKLVSLETDLLTYDIYLKNKKEINEREGLKLNWKYFISSCDFTPFKERIGEHIYNYLNLHPEANNEVFINMIILTYQILYYRLADSSKITQHYEKYFFKSQNYNKNVFQFTKPKGASKYYKLYLPTYSTIKSNSLFLNEEDLKIINNFGVDLNFPTQVENLFNFVEKSLQKEFNDFKLKSFEQSKLSERDYNLQVSVNDELYKFISNKHQFKVILSYVLRSVHSVPIDFYRKRFQGDEKKAYDKYYDSFGSFTKTCYYTGPIVDLFKPELNIDLKKQTENIAWEVEFTSFYEANFYSNIPQLPKEITRFSYIIPISNERLLLEFHPEYIYNQLLNPITTVKNPHSSINAYHSSNIHNSFTITYDIHKKDFSMNQYKFCMMINCGEGGLVKSFLKDTDTKEDVKYDHEISIYPSKLNLEFYNLMRIKEYDDYISTTPIENEAFIDKITTGQSVTEPEDTLAYMRYFEELLINDSKTVDYMSLILDYHKISSLQKGMEGFTNSLSDKIFSEIGSKQLLLLHGLSRKFILYNQIDYIIEKLNESINKDFELTKLRLVSRK